MSPVEASSLPKQDAPAAGGLIRLARSQCRHDQGTDQDSEHEAGEARPMTSHALTLHSSWGPDMAP